jgi:NAD(P)-dependent dehydrogenase (short-subunit alcohol dehydrogenase family)
MPPLLRRSPAGRIVNMPGGLGSLTPGTDPGYEFADYNLITYQSAKATLNAITVAYAKELRGTGIKVNAADLGFTATDLNNHRGYRIVGQGAVIAVRLATAGPDGPHRDLPGRERHRPLVAVARRCAFWQRAQSVNTWRGGCDCRFSKGCYTRWPNDCRRIYELSG